MVPSSILSFNFWIPGHVKTDYGRNNNIYYTFIQSIYILLETLDPNGQITAT